MDLEVKNQRYFWKVWSRLILLCFLCVLSCRPSYAMIHLFETYLNIFNGMHSLMNCGPLTLEILAVSFIFPWSWLEFINRKMQQCLLRMRKVRWKWLLSPSQSSTISFINSWTHKKSVKNLVHVPTTQELQLKWNTPGTSKESWYGHTKVERSSSVLTLNNTWTPSNQSPQDYY
jgi:hypothetical protein